MFLTSIIRGFGGQFLKAPIISATVSPNMSFVNRNLVMIVMLPVLGAIHYGWMKMSDQSDRKELPIISVSVRDDPGFTLNQIFTALSLQMFRTLTSKATNTSSGETGAD